MNLRNLERELHNYKSKLADIENSIKTGWTNNSLQQMRRLKDEYMLYTSRISNIQKKIKRMKEEEGMYK